MVSTAPSTSSPYITEYALPSTGGKSPLAMLAKTCETIGLLDSSSISLSSTKKTSATPDKEKKSSPTLSSTKKESSSSSSRSPASTPSSKHLPSSSTSSSSASATTSSSGVGGVPPPFLGCFPGAPGAGFPPFMGYHPFFSGMHPMASLLKPPCPNVMMQRPCTTAGCPSCTPSTEMISAFAAAAAAAAAASNPLFAAYAANPFMVPVSSSASCMPGFPMMSPFSMCLPSTSSSLPAMTSSVSAPFTSSSTSSTASSSTRLSCSWGDCGKTFSSVDDLMEHLKGHASSAAVSPVSSSSAPSSDSSSSGGKTSSKSSSVSSASSLARYHPYSKGSLPVSMAGAMMGGLPFPAALQAMYHQQRLMPTMPLP